MICANCGREFNPANRASPASSSSAMNQMRYCSMRCKRQAGNRRFYRNKTKPTRGALRRAKKKES